jgi:YidC/Oxa1 family membrane protein insertase
MKNVKKIAVIVVLTLLLTTGCTKSFKDETSNKVYTSNILCKPTDKETIKIYEENKIEIDKLPECKNLKANSGGYEGLWTNIFVKPLAFIIVKIGLLLKNYGYSIILLGILLRLLVFPLSKKTMDMSENMKKANPELQALEKKYAGRNDQESMMQKSQEMMLIYKKYNIKPASGCLVSLIQLPLFFAFLEAIQRIPVILEETTFGLYLGTTPSQALASGKWWYLIVVALIAVTTYFSMSNVNNSSALPDQAKQTKMMSIFMVVFITIMSMSLNIGIGLYWIATSAFAVGQNYLITRKSNN